MSEARSVQLAQLDVGSSLGPYRLVAAIGMGGMARVWAASDAAGNIVAIKTIRSDIGTDHGIDPAFQQMFFDEARIALLVKHPNVCETYELGADGANLYMVMEWIDGGSLYGILRNNNDRDAPDVPIFYRLAARIVADLCAGVHAAHEALDENGRPLDVVHRDISTQNVLITSQGKVKLTDFGVAKSVGQSHQTLTGQLKGKLSYMAPEQLQRGRPVDRRTDVFALGALLYRLTTGLRPFEGGNDIEIISQTLVGEYAPPSEIDPDFPPALGHIIERALQNHPDDRYRTVELLRQALEKYLKTSGLPVTAEHLAALVDERCGRQIQKQTATIRARSHSEHAFNQSMQPATSETRRPNRTALWIGLAAALGLAAVAIKSWPHDEPEPRIQASSTASAAVAVATVPSPPASVASAPMEIPPESPAAVPAENEPISVDPIDVEADAADVQVRIKPFVAPAASTRVVAPAPPKTADSAAANPLPNPYATPSGSNKPQPEVTKPE